MSRIKELNFAGIWRLAAIGLQNPLLVLPTLKATKRTMLICDRLFGKLHHKNNSTNAFRHALWNILICRNSFKILKKNEKAIIWAEKITSIHEKLMPNKALEKKMDLHNNKMGRIYFTELEEFSEMEIISFLKRKMEEAIKISDETEAETYKNKFVYIL